MTILFLGDVHGHFDHILPAIRAQQKVGKQVSAVIFLGDIEPQKPFEEEIKPILDTGVEVFWIRGNHDTDTKETWERLQGSMHRCIDGKVVEIDGLRVAGLGGVFRGEIWYPREEKLNTEPDYFDYASYCRAQEAKRPLRLRRQAGSQENSFTQQSPI